MSEETLKKTQDTVRPSSHSSVSQEAASGNGSAKATIDRYREALRKGVMLSQ